MLMITRFKQQFKNLWLLSLKPLLLWVVTRITPDNPKETLELTEADTILYVLPMRSFIDKLTLSYACNKGNLPKPSSFSSFLKNPKVSYLYLRLNKRDYLDHRTKHQELASALKAVRKKGSKSIKIVPVSPFWGKNPGREELSLTKLIFGHDENASWLRKALIVLFQGRNHTIQFSKPLELDDILSENFDPDFMSLKLKRVLKLHFRNVRQTVLGKKLYDREQVVNRIARSKLVQEEIEKESRSKKSSRTSLETRARRYARELAADQTYSMVRTFEIVLGKIWNKIFDGVDIINVENVSRCARQNFEIVYVPTHRSHLDYLLASYTVYQSGVPSPHIAAGINLNFWPMGWFLRRAGAFFIRRSFRGNRLYSAVVHEYLHFLLRKGYPITFFPEGGRSRTGRLLNLKTGMLAMIVQSFLRNSERPIAFIPVYLGYDKVMEVGTYLSELSGSKKKKESIFQLFQARKLLKAKYGKAYVSYGEPIVLNRFLDANYPDWRECDEVKPQWLPKAVQSLSNTISMRIHETAVLSPVSVMAVALLSSWQKALPIEELENYIDMLLDLSRNYPYHENVKITANSAKDIIEHTDALSCYSKFSFSGGSDVIHLNELQGIYMSYYRNNVIHLFAIPALIARFFKHQNDIEKADLSTAISNIFPLVKADFQLSWSEQELPAVIEKYLEVMIKLGLIIEDSSSDGLLKRPAPNFDQFENLSLLGNAMGLTFERYTLTISILAKHLRSGPVDEQKFETQCQNMTQRLAILNGINNPEFVDKGVIHKQIQLLKSKSLLSVDETGQLVISEKIEALANSSKKLLSYDARYSIDKIFGSTSVADDSSS